MTILIYDTGPERRQGKGMRLSLAIFCIFVCGASVKAQNGVSNVRDANGNLVRNTGTTASRGQVPGNKANGPTMNVPVAAPPTNPRSNKGARE
jgi:transcription elongation factor